MKPNANAPGVYGIRNKINNQWYVGSAAKTIKVRWQIHQHNLREGTHHSRHLQNAWNKYGADSFECVPLENCPPEKCVEREQAYMLLYRSADQRYGYNIHPEARSPLGVKRTEETRKKLSEVARNRSPELKARLAAVASTPEARRRSSDLHRGKVLSAETRAKISASVLSKVDDYRAKLSAALRGKPLSEAHKAAISAGTRGKRKNQQTRAKMSAYAKSRTPEHQAKITAGIRAANARKQAAKLSN